MYQPVEQEVGDATIRNFSETYFRPSDRLRKGLEEVVVFNEITEKREIPNGSVWVYEPGVSYRDEILKTDVGCGIARFRLDDEIPVESSYKEELWAALNEQDISIGRGNHFIDFTTYEPLGPYDDGQSLFVHSDMNKEQVRPSSFKESQQRMKDAGMQRRDVADSLLSTLGVSYEFTGDWMHNSVKQAKNGSWFYRKGSIDLRDESENGSGEGLLALTPNKGLFRYATDLSRPVWEDLHHSMQHGVGKQQSQNRFFRKWANTIKNKKEVYAVDSFNQELEENYQSFEAFSSAFGSLIKAMGSYRPDFILRTD